MADVSVIIPTYNRLWCLPEAIESCRHSNCVTEIIIVDDGSDDGTLEWLKNQKNLRVIRQQHWGKCWAVNQAFGLAAGKYVRFLDSDDLLDIAANDEQLALAQNIDADLVVSGYKIFTEDQTIIKTQPWITCDDFISQQLGECDASHYSAYLFRKEFINCIPHRPDFAFRDDRLFVLETALKNPLIAVHNGTALLHRSHEKGRLQDSYGLKQEVQNFQHLNIYKYVLNRLQEERRLTPRRIDASIMMLWPLCEWVAQNHLKEALEIHAWIQRLCPGFKAPERGIKGYLYHTAGFSFTQKLLRIARFIKYGWK